MVLKPNKGKPLNKGGGGSPLTGGAIWQLESKGDWHKCDEIDGGDNLRHLLLWPENVANGSQIVEVLNFLGMQRNPLLDKSDFENGSKLLETMCCLEYNPTVHGPP